MKKITMLMAGIASGCIWHVAEAQSSVSLYGVIDTGIEYQSTSAGSVARMVPGSLYGNRYGLKGSEDIGGGIHVNFQLEQGFYSTTGAASNAADAFNRQAWVGVSGSAGQVRFGLQNTPQYIFMNPELDPMAVMSLGSPMLSLNSLTIRVNNAISYFTPTIYGLTAQFMVALRDSTTKPSNGAQFYNAAVRYVKGPFRAAVGYEQAGNATGTSVLKVLNAGTSLGIGQARFYLAYHTERQTDNSIKRDVYGVSGSYAFSPSDQLALMYGYARDRTGQGNNAQEIGITYEYFLSKRTTLYGSAGFIQNRNKADFTLNGTSYAGTTVSPGENTRGIMLGMLHTF